jgi:HNH endonuclease
VLLDPPIIGALPRRLKENDMKKELDHAGLTEISVFTPDTKLHFSQDKAMDPGDDVPTDTTSKNPLIVVAPAPTPPQQPQQQRLVFCRTWSSEGNHPSYNLPANSNDDLIVAPFSGSDVSSISTSTRGHIQKVFQAAVLERDNKKCVVTGLVYKQGSGNVQAAHIIPVAERKDSARDSAQQAAGLWSVYDTCNGITLEARLHAAFDSYLWCMDERGIFRLSDAERDAAKIKEYGFDAWNGNTLRGLITDRGSGYPTAQLLKARYDLFLSKVDNKKQKEWQKVSRKKNK